MLLDFKIKGNYKQYSLNHLSDNDKRLIISNAKVISSTANSSVVEFFKFDDLKQDALPTSKREISVGDVLVLNYMYNSSLLIAPTLDSFQAARGGFKLNNFIHSDIFAAKLKINNQPYPTKEDFQEFAIDGNWRCKLRALSRKSKSINWTKNRLYSNLSSFRRIYSLSEYTENRRFIVVIEQWNFL